MASDQIEELRRDAAPTLQRIVIAIDPSGSGDEDADEVGIVACGLDENGLGFVLVDASGRYPPTEWAKWAVELYHHLHADRIVAEINYGGAMVESVIRAVDRNVSYRSVTASRGKVARAEPIAALYERKRVFHLGSFPELEDQMTSFTSNFDRAHAGYSPGRVDALVWSLTELMALPMPGYGIYEVTRARAEGRSIIPPGANPLLAVYRQAQARLAAGQSPFAPMSALDEPDHAVDASGKTAWRRRYEALLGPALPQPGSREFEEQ